MVVRQWVLVPESFHDDPDELAPWVQKAHAAALARGPASAKKPSRPAAVRRSKRKTGASRRPSRRPPQSRRKV
jgi:hypothetical protein